MKADGSRLVLHDVPLLLWVFGVVFAVAGGSMLYEDGPAAAMGWIFTGLDLQRWS
jgi:hypothetical protein